MSEAERLFGEGYLRSRSKGVWGLTTRKRHGSRNNLAELLRVVGTVLLEAEPLYTAGYLASDEKNFGPDHPSLANRLNNLALLYQAQGRYSEAEALLTRSLFILEKALGQDHPEVSTVLNNLGAFHFEQGNWAKAAGYYRQSTNLVIRRSRRGTEVVGKPMVGKIDSEAERWSFGFWRLVKAEYRLADFEKPSARDLARDTFLTAQWALGSKAATSLAQMAVRQATGEGSSQSLSASGRIWSVSGRRWTVR